ncbi:hypothetical protein ACWCPT_21945 [Streptomyces sp. NPDC002308]
MGRELAELVAPCPVEDPEDWPTAAEVLERVHVQGAFRCESGFLDLPVGAGSATAVRGGDAPMPDPARL